MSWPIRIPFSESVQGLDAAGVRTYLESLMDAFLLGRQPLQGGGPDADAATSAVTDADADDEVRCT